MKQCVSNEVQLITTLLLQSNMDKIMKTMLKLHQT